MKFLDRLARLAKPERASNNNDSAQNAWDNLAREVPFNPDAKAKINSDARAKAKTNANPHANNPGTNPNTLDPSAERQDTEQQDAERQQRKIISYIIYGPQALANHDVNITKAQEDYALEVLADDSKRENAERHILSHIRDPLNAPGATVESVFARNFAGRRQESRILATMVGTGFDNYNTIRPSAIQDFLQAFPLPMDFEAASQDFLDGIKRNNPPQKYAEYQRSMQRFKQSIYGKRQEYWDQMKVLNAKAESRNAMNKTETDASLKAELYDMMKKAEMDADPVRIRGQDYPLTPEALAQAGLAPEHLVKIGNRAIGLSGVFRADGRDCAIGYVKGDDGRVKVRGFYQSGSSGMWRYLPDCVCDPSGDLSYYGKSGICESEEKLTLPWQMQQKLGELAGSAAGRKDQETAAFGHQWWLLAGTARQYESKQALLASYIHGTAQNDLYRETPMESRRRIGYFGKDRDPEELDVQGELAPNFKAEIASFNLPTSEYGPVRMRVFNSMDEQMQYMFCECGEGIWLASVQTNDEVGSTGCKKSWVAAGDLATPLHEYGIQSGGYGDSIPGKVHYVSMWRNYLSRAPIIRKYMNRNM